MRKLNTMKILYAASIDVSNFSAPAVHVRGTCRSFGALGHDVKLLSAKNKLDIFSRVQDREEEIYWPEMRGGWRVFQMLVGIRLKKIIAEWNPDVVYLRFSPSEYIAKILKASGVPVALELNGEESIDSRYFHHMLEVANLVLVDDRHLATLVSHKFPTHGSKVHVHLSPVTDTDFFVPLDSSYCRASLSLDKEVFIIVHSSSFQTHHDFKTIEIAFREISNRNDPKSLLVLVGDGPMKSNVMSEMRDLISEGRVIFPGMVSHEILHKYICAADVTIDLLTVKKLKAGRSLTAFKLFEYAACNRPVITTVDEDFVIPQWAADSFKIIEPENSMALVNALLEVASNGDFWNNRAMVGGNYVRAERSLEAGAKTTIDYLERIF